MVFRIDETFLKRHSGFPSWKSIFWRKLEITRNGINQGLWVRNDRSEDSGIKISKKELFRTLTRVISLGNHWGKEQRVDTSNKLSCQRITTQKQNRRHYVELYTSVSCTSSANYHTILGVHCKARGTGSWQQPLETYCLQFGIW